MSIMENSVYVLFKKDSNIGLWHLVDYSQAIWSTFKDIKEYIDQQIEGGTGMLQDATNSWLLGSLGAFPNVANYKILKMKLNTFGVQEEDEIEECPNCGSGSLTTLTYNDGRCDRNIRECDECGWDKEL